MKIYLVIQTDRHVDATIIPFKDREKALKEAERRGKEAAIHYHVDFKPAHGKSPSSWLFYFYIEDVGQIVVDEKELIE